MESHSGELTLLERWQVIVRAKTIVIVVTLTITVVGIVYSLLATPIYRADVLLAPAAQEQPEGALFGSLSGIAALAGLSGQQSNTIEALAVLRSRDFTRAFIQEKNLLPVLYSDEWDGANKRWKGSNAKDWPDMQKAVKYFDQNIRLVRQDKVTGLVTLSIEWKSSQAAAEWANDLVDRLNVLMRQRAMDEASTNVHYLENELAGTAVVTMQQSIGRVLEAQLQKLMLARGNQEFAFRVLDRAEAPKLRIWPLRALISILSCGAGLLVSLIFVFLRDAFRRDTRVPGDARPPGTN
jgi:uncharacterized protein involved in exopolysaccharide biosynthesis